MPDMNQKLDRFTARILAEAAAESKQALEEVKRRREQRLRQAEDDVLREAYDYIHSGVSSIQAEAGRDVSRRLLENKRTVALRREEMSKEVFALVRAKITAFTRTDAYRRRMAELLREALEALGGVKQARITLRPEDMPLREELSRSVSPVQLAFQEGTFRLGGLIAEAPELGLRVDASFDSAAGELSGHFAELFGLSLADESERAVGSQ